MGGSLLAGRSLQPNEKAIVTIEVYGAMNAGDLQAFKEEMSRVVKARGGEIIGATVKQKDPGDRR